MRALYICYLSLDDPLTHTQVVAYLEGLAGRGHTIHLLTFEPDLDDARRSALQADLQRRGITWHALRYHKRPSLPATIYDALAGAVAATRLVRRHRLQAVHARNHVPAAAALMVRRLTGCELIFDVRGLMAEEYADAGRWKDGGVAFRITKLVERAALRRAKGIVTLTEAVVPYLFGDGRPAGAAHEVIPCCADLERLEVPAEARRATREELGAAGDRPLMLYVGKFTGWYMEREMVAFYVAARERIPGLRLAILTQADRAPVLEALDGAGVARSEVAITRAEPEDIGRYLAAADFGISFVRPCLSKISSSPTKIGEYLGAGLPVVSTAGIGDVDALLAEGTGVLVEDLGTDALTAAADGLAELLADDGTPARCRAVARRELSLTEVGVPRYDRLYRAVASAQRGAEG